MAASHSDQSFIFRDEDFGSENAEFDAAGFVSKFHRVIPLESLREQLVTYSNFIRKQLYVIINRDYKDFITIATKLDGLDSRVQVIQRPLVDLRVDLSSLHGSLASSLQAIQVKLSQKKQASQKRQCIETLVHCIDALHNAQQAINAFDHKHSQPQHTQTHASTTHTHSRHNLYKQFDRLKSYAHTQLVSTGQSPYTYAYTENTADIVRQEEVFVCAEYENCAHHIQHIYSMLDGIHVHIQDVPSHMHIYREVMGMVEKTKAMLIEKLKRQMENTLVQASNTAHTNIHTSDQSPSSAELQEQYRGVAHCLRALECVGGLKVVQDILKDVILPPVLKTHLSPGKVDGSGGKGSCAGLPASLTQLLHHIQHHQLHPILLLMVCMGYGEVCVYGVLQPVLGYIHQNYPQTFTTSIPQAFASNYICIRQFIEVFARSFQPIPDTAPAHTHTTEVVAHAHHLQHHPVVDKCMGMFKYEVYVQIRTKEIMVRCDGICALHLQQLRQKPTPLREKLSTIVYEKKGSGVTPIHFSVTPEDIHTLQGLVQPVNLHHDIYVCLLMEVMTCLHSQVALTSIYAKFVQILQKVCMRFVWHLCMCMDVHVEGLGVSRQEFEGVRGVYVGEGGGLDNGIVDVLLHIHDTYKVYAFLLTYIPTTYPVLLPSSMTPPLPGLALVQSLASTQWLGLKDSIVSAARKAVTSGVKTIAGKYRMTNKPRPSLPSTYVEEILSTLKSLLSEYKSQLVNLCTHFTSPPSGAPLTDWLADIVLAITHTYEEQVNSLFETVKSMDSALQRRAKILANTTQSSNASEALRDSDKIALQVQIDVVAFEEAVKNIDRNVVDHEKMREKYGKWKKQVDEMVQMQLQSKLA